MEKKSFLVTELLVFFLGFLGAHRYYTGYIGLGVLQTLTLGGCGIWALIDFIFISVGKYKDAKGQELEGYNRNIGLGAIILWIIAGALIQRGSKTVINNNIPQNNTPTIQTKFGSDENNYKEINFDNAKCKITAYGSICSGELTDEDELKIEEIQAELKNNE